MGLPARGYGWLRRKRPLQSAPMSALRRLHLLVCFMLAGFVVSVGAAIAAPFVNPQAMELICSSAGDVKFIVLGDDGTAEQRSQMLDCPLCVHLGGAAPPPAPLRLVQAPQPLAHALRPLVAAHIAARTAAPLPARGPPSFS